MSTHGRSLDLELPQEAFDALVSAVEEDGEVRTDRFVMGEDQTGYAIQVDNHTQHLGLSETNLERVLDRHVALILDWYFYTQVVGEWPVRRSFVGWLERENGDWVDEEPAVDDGWNVETRYARLDAGIAREWGQLHITVEIDRDGDRQYEIRHTDDVDVDPENLTAYEDPYDARRLVKFDDDGRYRPLKAAPSLPTGWVFQDLDAHEVYELVDLVYPATVANWYRERVGELDVSHWRETVERQSGIYGVVKTWDRGEGHDHVDRVAAACCADSQCLKRREWEYDDETDLDAPSGDGWFPCREPCSVVVSAARKWTRLESEESRSYEFELTPSEKEQLEAIVDAIADDETDDIREADFGEGANRYRVRYLREKLFDEDGNLCGVPTGRDDAENE